MARVGGQCNCTRVDTFSTEETVFGITVPRDLEALLKATRDVPGLNCRCYLPNISFFTRPSTAVGTYTLRSETTFKPIYKIIIASPRSSSKNFNLFLFVFLLVERYDELIRGKSDRRYVRSTSTLFPVRRFFSFFGFTGNEVDISRALGANSNVENREVEYWVFYVNRGKRSLFVSLLVFPRSVEKFYLLSRKFSN